MSASERCDAGADVRVCVRVRVPRGVAVAGLAVLCCGMAAPAMAQQAPNREQEQLRRLRQQVQQLQQEQSAHAAAAQRAAAQTGEVQSELDATAGELQRARVATAVRARTAAADRLALETLRQERDALLAAARDTNAALQASQGNLTALRAERGDLQRTLGIRETSLSELQARHAAQAEGLQTCTANNLALRDLGRELLQRYADKGVSEVLAQREPVLQLERVKLENLVQGYAERLDRQALRAGPAPSAAPASDPARAR